MQLFPFRELGMKKKTDPRRDLGSEWHIYNAGLREHSPASGTDRARISEAQVKPEAVSPEGRF
ncbi:hypothetical protein PM082_009826 [Marasmius tenuissimus]|nr:hypothetical protein PM082_009826 [Marasmius tenuissimus]